MSDIEAYKKGVKDTNARIEPLIREIHDLVADKAYQQGRADVFKDCILDSKEYCWQECCATEHCGECSRLDNGQIDYFDNTFATHELSYADMPTTP